MSQNPNQFSQSVVKGLADLRLSPSVISCRVDAAQAVALIAGQCVKLKDVAGGSPVIEAIADDEDKVFGVVLYNIKDSSFSANEAVEVAFDGSVVYMEAGAAIARGADVMPVVTGSKVATAAGNDKAIIGIALDKAAADGDLIRVLIGKKYNFTPAA